MTMAMRLQMHVLHEEEDAIDDGASTPPPPMWCKVDSSYDEESSVLTPRGVYPDKAFGTDLCTKFSRFARIQSLAYEETSVEPVRAPDRTKDLDVPMVDDERKSASAGNFEITGWTIGHKLGEGNYATVYLAKNQVNRSTAVVKVVEKARLENLEDWSNMRKELEVMTKLGVHPHIPALLGTFQSNTRVYLFMEPAQGKELFHIIELRAQNDAPVSKDGVKGVFSSISSALAHWHEKGICHRDVKPENILVDNSYCAKLVDFGCACPRTDLQNQCVGSMPFIAPEFLCGTATDGAPADVWALGVVVLEMLCGLQALTRALRWDRDKSTTEAKGQELAEVFSEPARGLQKVRKALNKFHPFHDEAMLAAMLHGDPSQRPLAITLNTSAS